MNNKPIKNNKLTEKVKKYMSLPYTIELIPEEDGTWFARIKELKGCMSAGDTIEEAVRMVKEAQELWIEDMLDRGFEIPLPEVVRFDKGEREVIIYLPKKVYFEIRKDNLYPEKEIEKIIIDKYSKVEPQYKNNTESKPDK